jgi:hypothetical protein
MTQNLLTASIIADKALDILENNLVAANLVYRGYEDEFEKSINGYSVGSSVSVRRPAQFTIRTGATMATQDVVEGKFAISVDQQAGVDFQVLLHRSHLEDRGSGRTRDEAGAAAGRQQGR